MILCLLTLLCYLTFEPCLGCHWTSVTIRNGTWCCGGGGQQDVPTDVPPPPPPPSTTTKTTTPTTKPPSTTPPRPHVEDCPCGENIEGMEMAMEKWAKATKNESAIENRVLSQDPEFTPYLVRPWVVRIVVTKDSGEKIECSGSILNKRYIITAAHCFCSNLVKCTTDQQERKKVHELGMLKKSVEIIFTEEPRLGTHVMLHLGNTKMKTNITLRGIQRLIVHPNYYQITSESVVGHTDVALIKTKNDLFELKNDGTIRGRSVQPICLPPKLGYDPSKNQTNQKIFEAFEDLDCRVVNSKIMLYIPKSSTSNNSDKKPPYPYTEKDFAHLNLPWQQWLSCHPGKYTSAWQVNIMGRSTFITSYGSTSREDFHEKVRYQCSTNSYGPTDSVFSMCHSKCHKDLKQPIEVKVPLVSGNTTSKYVTHGNPSFADEMCNKFKKLKWTEIMHIQEQELKRLGEKKSGDSVHDRNPALIWLKVVDTKNNNTEHMCYPLTHDHTHLMRNMFDFPFKYGWCKTCKEGSVNNCMPEPNKGWGWCQPQCDETMYPPVEKNIHEAAVDSFKYEKCSHNFNMDTEFCTAAPVLRGYGQVWNFDGKDFNLVQKELRVVHDPMKDKFSGTHNQHTNNVGDVCYGDAGGSVWKFWVFRDNSTTTENRNRKLAVLTGVISRFEEKCGWMNPLPPSSSHLHKSKQTTSTRITAIHDWITHHIKDGKCGESMSKPVTPPAWMNMDEEEVIESDMYGFEERGPIPIDDSMDGEVPYYAED